MSGNGRKGTPRRDGRVAALEALSALGKSWQWKIIPWSPETVHRFETGQAAGPASRPASPGGFCIWEYRYEERQLSLSRGFLRLFDISSPDLVLDAAEFRSCVPPKVYRSFHALTTRLRVEGGAVRRLLLMTKPGGGQRLQFHAAQTLSDGRGNVVKAFGFAREIRSRKRPRPEPKMADATFHLMESMPVAMAAFNEKDEAVFWNGEAERILERSLGSGCGSWVREPVDVGECLRRQIRAYRDRCRGDDWNRRVAMTTERGVRKDLLVSHVAGGIPIFGWSYQLFALDISEHVKAGLRRDAVLERIRGLMADLPPVSTLEQPQVRQGRSLRDFRITEKEADVVKHLIKGKPNKEIAAACGISVSTVKVHVYSIYRKLKVGNRLELYRFIVDKGIPV